MTWAEKIPTDEREAEAVVADFEAQVFALSDRRITAGLRQAGPELKGLVQRMEKLSTSGAPVLSGVATGFRLLDEYTGGFQPGDLVLIAGRPGSGKTSLALNIATRCQAAKPVVTAFFSLEMTAESLLTRMLVQEARLDYKAMRAARIGQDGWATVARVLPGLSMAPLWIDDTARQTVNEMRAKCRRLAAQQPLGMVVIDHIGKVSPSRWFKSLNESLTEISQDCKTMAKELNVPVVVLSQLSRECERRSPKHPRPMLSDLRDSGSLEQDADLVLMLYRDSVYNPKDEDAQGKAELIIAKQRNGPCVDVMLTFQNAFMRFESYTPAPDVP
jgi:replicative DNA helicase